MSGILFLILFAGILLFIRKNSRESDTARPAVVRHPVLWTVAGLLAVLIGSHLLITAAVDLAELFGIPPYVIGISLIAVGTSLPELATSLVAAVKNSPAISVGNIVGSNIFNLLFILGINSLFTPIAVPGLVDTLVMTGFAVGIFVFFYGGRLQTRLFALFMLVAYGVFVAVKFVPG
jgi:cation:H+ antiporter